MRSARLNVTDPLFINALKRCGCNDGHIAALAAQGIKVSEDFAIIGEDTLKDTIQVIRKELRGE